MSGLEKIANELKGLGYELSYIEDTPQGPAVVIEYSIETGKYIGQKVRLGFSFQGDEGYPEYPPHWIHISPPYNDQLGGSVQEYESGGNKWLALSRTPGDLWDKLSTKHMQNYLKLHITKFCKYLK